MIFVNFIKNQQQKQKTKMLSLIFSNHLRMIEIDKIKITEGKIDYYRYTFFLLIKKKTFFLLITKKDKQK